MKRKPAVERIAWVVAGLAMLLGTGALLRTVLVSRGVIDGMYGKLERVHQLTLLRAEADGLRAALVTLERDTSSRPSDIHELARTYLEQAEVKPKLLAPEQTEYGWVIQKAEIEFEHLNWEQISLFLKKAESQRPPWRIEEMSLRPKDQSGLSGRLRLHALQKTEI